MDYVALLTFRSTTSAEARDAGLIRRAMWNYPDGIDVIAEYWPMGSAPQVIAIFTANDPAALMQLEFEWNDIFDVDIFPAVSAAKGLEIGPDVFAKLDRLQPA